MTHSALAQSPRTPVMYHYTIRDYAVKSRDAPFKLTEYRHRALPVVGTGTPGR